LRPSAKRVGTRESRESGYTSSVRAMFVLYLTFIVAALAFFVALGIRG
jgi:hypothetical protein